METILSNSRHVLVNKSHFTSVNYHGQSAFEKLHANIADGAMHDSQARFDAPKCHPGTRTAILKQLIGIVDNPRDTLICWIYGPPEAGKSAIMQSLAESCHDSGYLIASFFFSRTGTNRYDEKRLMTTIAYQLAIAIPKTRSFIENAIQRDPAFSAKSLKAQLQTLIIDPLNHVVAAGLENSPLPHAILIDGLDECATRPIQHHILTCLSTVPKKCKFPIVFLVASRPEPHLDISFNTFQSGLVRMELDDDYRREEPGGFCDVKDSTRIELAPQTNRRSEKSPHYPARSEKDHEQPKITVQAESISSSQINITEFPAVPYPSCLTPPDQAHGHPSAAPLTPMSSLIEPSKTRGHGRGCIAARVSLDIWKEVKASDIIIFVMGPTGSGKSTFINEAVGSPLLTVSKQMKSCTSQPCSVVVDPIPHFTNLEGRRLVLVDLPGFDHTINNDIETWTQIAQRLKEFYRKNVFLIGVLYLHDISIKTLTLADKANLKMFSCLWSHASFIKVVLVTTNWGDTPDHVQRGNELKNTHWKKLIRRGADVRNFLKDPDSAWDIIDVILSQEAKAGLDEAVARIDKLLEKMQASQAPLPRRILKWLHLS